MPVPRHNNIDMVRSGKCHQVVVIGIGRLERTGGAILDHLGTVE